MGQAMTAEPTLVIQVPQGTSVQRQLRADPPPSVAGGRVVVETGVTDAEGALEPPAAGEVVLSVPSPEALAREAAEVERVIARAGTGVEPLVVEVEAAEELREDELAAVLGPAARAARPVILRVIRGV
jgi:hypothetical protein